MTVTAGALTLLAVGATTANLSSAAATGGTGPYGYQWYRSTTTGFSPGGGNIISGATALALNDSGLLPNTIYFYVVVATDTGHSNDTSNSAQLAVTTTQETQSQNQFAQSVITGVLDLRLNFNTIAVQVDASETGRVVPGTALKYANTSYSGGNSVPQVLIATAITDEVCGFANYNMKDPGWIAGHVFEMSVDGNVMYLLATTTINRGAQVCMDPLTKGGVKPIVSTANYVGYTIDKATAPGQNVRVMIKAPSFVFAS